jgi:chromosome segregation ATPase
MAAAAQTEAVIEVADRPSSPKRPSRTPKSSAKVREVMQSLEDAATMSRRTTIYATRSTASKGTRVLGSGSGVNGQAEAGKTLLQMLLQAIDEQQNETRETIAELRNVVGRQQDAIQQLCEELRQTRDETRDVVSNQQDAIQQLSEELRQARDQIDALVRNAALPHTAQTSLRASYAEVARTPPASQPSGLRTISVSNTTPTTLTDTLFCTVDTSRVEKKRKGKSKWRISERQSSRRSKSGEVKKTGAAQRW